MRENVKIDEEKERRETHFGISLVKEIVNIYIKHTCQHFLYC